MEDLIKALQIFLKYANEKWPTHCEHDIMYIMGVVSSSVSQEDKDELKRLGFNVDEETESFYSHRFGSA